MFNRRSLAALAGATILAVSATLPALAQAWALAVRLRDATTAVPDALLGTRSQRDAEVGRLAPLAVRWWTSAA